jgi:hypothetical protein
MSDIETGFCDYCKQEKPLTRKYFHFPHIICTCCNGENDGHFVIARHCSSCEPVAPEQFVVHIKAKPIHDLNKLYAIKSVGMALSLWERRTTQFYDEVKKQFKQLLKLQLESNEKYEKYKKIRSFCGLPGTPLPMEVFYAPEVITITHVANQGRELNIFLKELKAEHDSLHEKYLDLVLQNI